MQKGIAKGDKHHSRDTSDGGLIVLYNKESYGHYAHWNNRYIKFGKSLMNYSYKKLRVKSYHVKEHVDKEFGNSIKAKGMAQNTKTYNLNTKVHEKARIWIYQDFPVTHFFSSSSDFCLPHEWYEIWLFLYL